MSASGSSTASSGGIVADGVPAGRARLAAGRALPTVAVATAVSSAGSVLNVLALLTYLYERTSSPLPVGLAVLLNFLPVVTILPLVAGRMGRWTLRFTAGGAAFLQAAIVGAMAVVAAVRGPLAVLFIASSALGLLTQIVWIAVLSAMPRLVDPQRLREGNILLQTASQTGAVLGALGLVVQGSASAWVLFLIDAVTFVVQGTVLVALLPAREREAAGEQHGASTPEPVARTRQAWGWHTVGLVFLMPAGFIAMNVLNVTIPLIVYSRLHAGQGQYAAAEMAYPVLAVVVGMLLRRYGKVPLPVALAGITAGLIGLALVPNLAGLLICVGVLGGSIIAANVSTQVLAQSQVPAAALPRVQSSASVVAAVTSSVAIVALAAGFDRGADAGALLGVASWYVLLLPLGLAVGRAFAARVPQQEG